MGIFEFGRKVIKPIATTTEKNDAIVQAATKAVKYSKTPENGAKVIQRVVNDNVKNQELLKLINEMGKKKPESPLGKALTKTDEHTKALLEKVNNYTPHEFKSVPINTDKGYISFTPKNLDPKDVADISKLFGKPSIWNRNLGKSAGNINAYIPDDVIEAYNTAIKNQDILKSLEGNPVNKDSVGKFLYNSAASAAWGSAGNDMAQVANRFNGNSEDGNPDNIWTNPKVIGLTSALTRFAFPLVKQLANVPVNANTLARIADLTVPAAVGKVVNNATTPDPTPSKPWEEFAVKVMNKVNTIPKNNPNNSDNSDTSGTNW